MFGLRSLNGVVKRNEVLIEKNTYGNDINYHILETNIHLFHTLEMATSDTSRNEKDIYLFFWDEHDLTKIRVLGIEQSKGDTHMSWLDDELATQLIVNEIRNFKESK